MNYLDKYLEDVNRRADTVAHFVQFGNGQGAVESAADVPKLLRIIEALVREQNPFDSDLHIELDRIASEP